MTCFRGIPPRRRTNERGLGLVELVVSIGLITLAILGLDTLATAMIRGNFSARLNDEATRYAQSKMEQVRQAGYDATAVGTTIETLLDTKPNAAVVFTRQTTIAAGTLANTKTVSVTMMWPDKTTRQALFQTEISK